MKATAKRKTKLTALLLAFVLAAGCTRGDAGDLSKTAEKSGQESMTNGESGSYEPVEAPTSFVTDEMYKTATASKDTDISRLAAVMRRAEAGDEITVAVIGGSITQGSAASSSDKAYASIMAQWWKESFPKSNVEFVNAGIGATDSYLGVHRVEEDVLSHNPDFVIVEFSVNDSNTNFYKTSYDNLVRRLMGAECKPAVLLLYMVMEDGTSAYAQHALAGFTYKLPQIAYGNAVMDCIRNGEFIWKDISPDNIHPNDYGHAICGEMIWKYLNEVRTRAADCPEPVDTVQSALTRDTYMNARILDNRDAVPDEAEGFAEGCVSWSHFKDGWSTKEGGRLVFKVRASRIGLLYYKCVTPGYGKAVIKVDGTETTSLNGDFSGGWGNYGYAQQIFADSEVKEHVVEITVDPEAGGKFDIFGILVSE